MSTVTRRAGAQMVDGEMVFASAVVGVLFVSVGIFVYSRSWARSSRAHSVRCLSTRSS